MYRYKLKEECSPLFSFDTKHGPSYFVSFKKMDFDNPYFLNFSGGIFKLQIDSAKIRLF